MVKSQNQNTRAVLAVILMLAASPLAVTYSHAEVTDENEQEISKSVEMTRGEKVKAVLAERVVDGKLQVRQFNIAKDASPDEIHKTLTFEGKTTGWAYVSGKAYNSGIVLFDGKAIKIGERSWELGSSKGEMEVVIAGRTLDLDLKGKAHEHRVMLHGAATTNDDDLEYRIVLLGNVAQSGEDDIFAIAFVHAGLKNPESGPNIKLFHLGQIAIQSPDGDKPIFDSFKESVSVA